MNNELENRVLIEAKYIIKTRKTIRECAKIFAVSKSTFHQDVSKRLQKINRSLYLDVQKILSYNFKQKHLRGGQSTKKLYLLKKTGLENGNNKL